MANEPKLENFLNLSLDRVMSDRFGRYSKYIIQDRALPDARDGLKPVQRRILYSMHDLGLLYNKAYKKSARVVGDVIGKYHPHGDSSIYEAMVRMSQDWKMNVPLIQMHGNNGSIDDDPAAAMRYTEARLSKISKELLTNIKKDTVLFAPNFDDSEKEPTVLPALFPNLLTNGAKGIAAGYATEMPPHNLGEVIDTIIAKIKSPNARLDTLLNFIKGPDFPTGGIIQGQDGIYQAFERGRGRIVIRSKYEVIELKTKPAIIITEIPYGVIKSKLVRDIDEIRFNNRISGIKEVRDETDRNGITIAIELTPGTDAKLVEKYLLQKTDLQVYYNYNNVAIKNKVPTTMGLIPLIDAYLAHQRSVQNNALTFNLNKDKRRLEIVEGLIRVAKITDQVIETIKAAEGSKSGVINSLIKKYQFTELQAQAIAELRLYRLSRSDQSLYLEEQKELQESIAYIEDILSSEKSLDKYLIKLLKELKSEYATERKTEVHSEIEAISVNADELIKHENVWVGISRDGYIKRFSNRAYEANNIDTYTLKENDSLQSLEFMNTSDRLLIFTNKGNYYSLPVHKIEETKYKVVGKHINDFAAIPIDEKILTAIPVSDFNIKANIIQVTKHGRAKSTPVKSFAVTRHTKTYRSFKLANNDEVVGAKISNGFKEIVIVTTDGRAVRYAETQLSTQGSSSSGSKAISLKNSEISNFALAHGEDVIGMVSKRGGMKRIKLNNIMPMSKTTKGQHLFREIKGNPHIIIDMAVVTPKTNALYFTTEIQVKQMGAVDITSTEEGLSLIGPPQTFDAKILTSNYIDKNNKDLEMVDANLSDAAKFEKAEKALEAINQLSLDDLLKDL